MSVTIKTRPQGAVFSTTGVIATIGASSTDLTLTSTSHGLNTDDMVYVTYRSAEFIWPGSYFGYFYVYKVDANTFKLKDKKGAYVQIAGPTGDTLIYYKHTLKHYYNALHLPIQYVLYSDTVPNTLDTARTVSSIANDNGYMQITASGDIKATGSAAKLDWVKISNGDNDGLYQIISYTSDTVFTINMPYSASSTLAGDTIQYYYNNYFISVKIYGGLVSTHYVNTLANPLKPFTLITTINVAPDSSGYVYLNVSNYLKNQVDIMKNNSLSDVYTLDIDSFTQFYISTVDYWDVSNGTTVTSTASGSYTADTVYPYAINASMPFGNRHSGFMSDYIYGDSNNLGKFLTPMQNPKIFPGQYWDISYIDSVGSFVFVKREYYLNGVLQSTNYQSNNSYGIGVCRHTLTIGASEDRIDLTTVLYSIMYGLALWTNTGSGTSWTLGASPSVSSASSKYLTGPFIFLPNVTYSFTFSVTISGGSIPQIDVYTDQLESIYSTLVTVSNHVISFTPTIRADNIYIKLTETDIGTPTATITKFDYTSQYITISETKTVTVDTVCSNNFRDKYVDLTWKNYLGGFDYWRFKAFSERGLDILETRETQKNIFQEWPASYNEFQDRITYETLRTSKQTIVVRAENLTQDEINDLFMIKASPLVQIMSSRSGKKTVIVDKDSFVYNNEKDNLQSLSFKLTMTNELPAQSL